MTNPSPVVATVERSTSASVNKELRNPSYRFDESLHWPTVSHCGVDCRCGADGSVSLKRLHSRSLQVFNATLLIVIEALRTGSQFSFINQTFNNQVIKVRPLRTLATSGLSRNLSFRFIYMSELSISLIHRWNLLYETV